MRKLQVIGEGDPQCREMGQVALSAAHALGVDLEIQNVTDRRRIAEMGIMTTPALAVDWDVKVSGRVPGLHETIQILLG